MFVFCCPYCYYTAAVIEVFRFCLPLGLQQRIDKNDEIRLSKELATNFIIDLLCRAINMPTSTSQFSGLHPSAAPQKKHRSRV